MTVRIRGNTRVRSQTLVGFPPQPALNLDFTKGYANGLNPLPSTVTFTRADASAIATQVGPDGLVRLAAHNLLTYSEQFDNAAWTKTNLLAFGAGSVANATTAPDGTVTADKIVEDTANGAHGVSQSASFVAQLYTFTVYAKPAGRSWMRLGQSGVGADTWFDLSNGVIGSIGATSASILPAGNGWFRCSITFTAGAGSASGLIRISTSNGVATYAGDGSSGLFIWGAQLEQNLTPSYYVATTTAAVYANTPRFDYDPVTTEPRGLLIEEARTNYLTYSNTFSNAAWTISGLSAPVANAIGPDGSLNSAWTITANSGSTSLFYQSSIQTDVTQSIYVKAGTANYVFFQTNDSSSRTRVSYFNIFTGSWGTVNQGSSAAPSFIHTALTPQNMGNGWWRISVAISGGATSLIVFGICDADGNRACASGKTAVIYQQDLQNGLFLTSSIPTVASSVTRAAESATMTGTNFSSWYSATTGTFLVGFDTQASGTRPVINVDDNTANEQIQIYTTGTTPTYNVIDGGSPQATITTGTVNNTALYLMAAEYGSNDFSAAMNGTLGTPDTSGTLPTVDRLRIGSDQAGNRLNDHVTKIQYWPARFTDARLQLLSRGP